MFETYKKKLKEQQKNTENTSLALARLSSF